jgi:hypothetical protein
MTACGAMDPALRRGDGYGEPFWIKKEKREIMAKTANTDPDVWKQLMLEIYQLYLINQALRKDNERLRYQNEKLKKKLKNKK